MLFPLDYKQYSVQPLDEQIDWFDQLEWESIAQPQEQKSIKAFFQDVYNEDASNYTRKKAIEWFSELALGSVIRLAAAQDFLLDIDEPETYIQIAKIKYLFLLFGDTPEVNTTLDEALRNDDAEIASEVYYRKGLIHLLYRTGQTSEQDFLHELSHARKHFNEAADILENRVDAQFFSLITQCLEELAASQKILYDATLAKLSSILWQREVWGRTRVSDLFEWHIYCSLTNIRAAAEHVQKQATSWLDFRQAFTLLAKYANDAIALHSLSRQFQRAYKEFTSSVTTRLLDEYYIKKFSASLLRIDAQITDLGETDPPLTSFLLSLKASILANAQKKSPETNLSLLARFHLLFPEIESGKITYDLKQLTDNGETQEAAMLKLIFQYNTQLSSNRNFLKTGSLSGDKILENISIYLKKEIPNYPRDEFAIFSDVLADLITFAFNAETGDKADYSLYYDSTIRAEEDFQRDLYSRLRITPRLQYYRMEVSNAGSSGRIDILYEEMGILFPIEVKRESKLSTWAEVERNYLPQAQTYTTPYNQLGFLVIFEISSKKVGQPLPDFKDRFHVLRSSPLYALTSNHPDYIVAIVIPANRITPSQLTRYHS